MARKTFAIGNKETGEVSLWCSGNKNAFFVINGYWDGGIEDGLLHFKKYPQMNYLADVIWEGYVPVELDNDKSYNEAIVWIEERIKNKITIDDEFFKEEPEEIYDEEDEIPF